MADEKTEVKEIGQEDLDTAVSYLTKAAEMLGFAIALPNPGDDEDALVDGFLVGTDDFIKRYVEAIDAKQKS